MNNMNCNLCNVCNTYLVSSIQHGGEEEKYIEVFLLHFIFVLNNLNRKMPDELKEAME